MREFRLPLFYRGHQPDKKPGNIILVGQMWATRTADSATAMRNKALRGDPNGIRAKLNSIGDAKTQKVGRIVHLVAVPGGIESDTTVQPVATDDD
ncbi:MAG TPA: hypothetical protein VMU38_10945 [Candidatus Binatia bacterium]|nr:hypothetical protein [Candidatus Binatia bacterium]